MGHLGTTRNPRPLVGAGVFLRYGSLGDDDALLFRYEVDDFLHSGGRLIAC